MKCCVRCMLVLGHLADSLIFIETLWDDMAFFDWGELGQAHKPRQDRPGPCQSRSLGRLKWQMQRPRTKFSCPINIFGNALLMPRSSCCSTLSRLTQLKLHSFLMPMAMGCVQIAVIFHYVLSTFIYYNDLIAHIRLKQEIVRFNAVQAIWFPFASSPSCLCLFVLLRGRSLWGHVGRQYIEADAILTGFYVAFGFLGSGYETDGGPDQAQNGQGPSRAKRAPRYDGFLSNHAMNFNLYIYI